MWHLILPPLIIISGIGLLLWFLSRRMDDPSFRLRMKSASGEVSADRRSRSLSRKAFFLKLLEKTASKSKTGALRIHNFFQFSLERLREKRRAIDEMRREAKRSQSPEEPIAAGKQASVGSRWFWKKQREQDASVEIAETGETVVKRSEESAPETGTIPERRFRRTFGFLEKRTIAAVDAPEPDPAPSPSPVPESVSEPVSISEPEPVLKRRVARPEHSNDPAPMKKDPREERLIASIAENPRDAVAYESLGDLYLETGSMQDAKACYRQVLKLHPTNRAVKLKIRKVERFFEKSVS